jgi:hypothetical protein
MRHEDEHLKAALILRSSSRSLKPASLVWRVELEQKNLAGLIPRPVGRLV